MIEVVGNLWTYPADWRIITTNGFVKSNGECVMGRGCAREAKVQFPKLAKELGTQIKEVGNVVHRFDQYKLLSFPVKHSWWEKADLALIQQSVNQLQELLLGQFDETEIVMPRPGCGNGQLSWKDVQPIMAQLPDNIKVIDFD
jgi:hypothetical protein